MATFSSSFQPPKNRPCIWVVVATLSRSTSQTFRNWQAVPKLPTVNPKSQKMHAKDRIQFPFAEHRRQNQSAVIRVDTDRSQNTLESKDANAHVHTM